jgi:hypothetical protein
LRFYLDNKGEVVDKAHKQSTCRGNLPRVPWTTGYGPKTLDMTGSLQWQRAGEPYVSYVALQAHGIANVALYREYSPGIVFIFSQGRRDIYHV